jgi:UDP-glucuronate 4-epimerase
MTDAEPILVTGAAGFIGFHVARRLLERGTSVLGIDNLDPYYDVRLKGARLEQLGRFAKFGFERLDVSDRQAMAAWFAARRFAAVVHLAAQAGVRHSLDHPHAYLEANLAGFLNVLEGCRAQKSRHLVYASSSSVYGANATTPFKTEAPADHPLSLYGATKRANELMAHAYAHLFAVPASGLRFFTVYGPWGRPDMAAWRFTAAVLEGRPVPLFNYGRMRRDFTYVDDAAEAVLRILERTPPGDPQWSGEHPDPSGSRAPWRLYNVGSGRSVEIGELLRLIETAAGRTAERELLPMQPGDVVETCADITDLERETGFRPGVPVEEGVPRFVAWYRDHGCGEAR